MRSVASPPVSPQRELLHWAFGPPPSVSPSVPLATVPSAGEPGSRGAGTGNGRHDGGPCQVEARLPAAAPGLLATPQPGLESCLSFFVSDF